MHKYILKFFNGLKSFWHFMKIVWVFCIIMLLLFWIQNLTHAEWSWMGFITPFLKSLLEIANNIYSISFNIWGAVFKLKYISAIVILLVLYFCMNLLIIITCALEGLYKSTHYICKKTEEAVLNKSLKEQIEAEEKKISKYVVTIHTEVKAKFSHKEINVDLKAQNEYMNKFIMEKLEIAPIPYEGGFMYSFTDFNKIDSVLKILFKVLHSTTPLDYSICIQAGEQTPENIRQLNKLISLKHFGKITMAADTSYRYRYNETHRYQTSQIGVFQYGDKTLEVHEFKQFEI